MAVDVRLVTAALVICAASVAFAQEQTRCSYMTEIPRPPTPDFPDEDYDFSGYTWRDRPLLPPEFREEVCMDEFVPFVNIQLIYMEEEIEGDVVIARLNYRGIDQPIIRSGTGSLNLLGPEIRRMPEITGDWHLVITQRQDYESPNMRSYLFTVEVAGDTVMQPMVALEIVNIDDNPPIVQVFGPCHIAENEEPGLTRCTYNVSDADGRISTSAMTFELESDRNDREIFSLVGRNEPSQWMWMHMTLELKGELNFANNALHIFRVTARDSLPNEHTVTVMVEVENVESRPPRWVEILTMAQFDEKQPQEFTVRAVDGDTGINREIQYRLQTDPEDTFFHITGGPDGALFNVDAIDRDALQREVFHLSIIAFKIDDEGKEYATSTNVVIIVNDINDQIPEPFQEVYTINILEETAMTLNLENFGFHDRDLGEHAQYKVELEAVTPEGAVAGFQVAPQSGYQRQNFIMTTLNHNLLDYDMIEDGAPTHQNIILKVVATDLHNTSHVGVATVNVNLINWNDELPIFEQSTQTVRFRETVDAGHFVAVVRAHDRDIDDRVVHQLLGNAGNYLQIDESTGVVTVSVDDAFDYHRQSELFIQVQAVDTLGDGPYHSATSQLVIQLIDVNNTPPNIRLPRTRPEVEENVPEGFPIPAEITATDADTDAELVFEIDWSTSYATKQGRETPAVEFHGCVEIQTTYPDPTNKRSAVGKLIVKEIRPGVTIDFEEFEVLYVTVRVRDLMTEIGIEFDEAIFTIIIIDMNDNSPLWAEGSLAQEFRIREKSDTGVVIGSVMATDIDGPLYNRVRYTIFPREDTPEDLVAINFVTGQLTVKLPNEIDADVPPRYHLFYTLRASDQCYAEDTADCPPDPTFNYKDGDIAISIIDTNNKEPHVELEKFQQTVYVYENETTGFVIETVVASDLDRDEIYHTLNYQIDYRVNPRLRDFFAIDTTTGVVTVHYTTDETLDRDGDEPTHTIFFIIQDNFLREGDGNSNQGDTRIEVILLDVNDNAPELPPSDQLSWTISENTPTETILHPDILAPDIDEPNTDNSRVGYAIESLTVTNRDIEVPDLFTMRQILNITGELETIMHLQGYWGVYDIRIRAFDYGHPQQSSQETYRMVITVYNFHDPVFVFPQPDTVIRLARERISVNGLLVKVNQEFLERIEATDEDGEQAGIVTFQVIGNNNNAEAEEYFRVVNDAENSGALMLLRTFEENIRQFTVTIRGTDGGTDPFPRSSDVTMTLVFVPTQGEPVFEEHTFTVSFVEGDGGLDESHELPHAVDDKNHLCVDDCHITYYTIIEGNAGGHFTIEPTTNTLYLAHPLDRSEHAVHTVQVIATNSPDSHNVLSSNTLTVTVNVREANPRPRFERHLYTAGISTQDVIQRVLLTLQATHTEEADITYTIDQSTMEVDSSLAGVRDNAFILNPSTGVLTLNIQPTASMHGMFEFQAVATDTNGAYDRTDVKIFLISALNRVFFRFRNTLQHIEANIDFIEQTFSAGFRMTCNIDQVVPATDASTGAIIPELVEARAHFIRDDLPVPSTEIEGLRGDVILLGMIQTTLDRELVVLEDFVTEMSPGQTDNTQVTLYVLIGVIVVLGLLCLVLVVVFIVRTRTLNHRLKALSTTKYGSVDSGLNRMGITAPGTNKHAVEGSNPIWNETINAPNFDALSNVSNDSDLIGVEDLPQFRQDYFPPASDMELPRVKSRHEPVSNHNNNFGFNASPFSPNSGNSNYRR